MGGTSSAGRRLSRPAKEYTNPLGIAANAVTDTGAFSTCP